MCGWGNLADTALIKINITNMTYLHHGLPGMASDEGQATFVVFFLIIHDLCPSTRKHETNLTSGTVYKITDQLFFQNLKVIKDNKRQRKCYRLKI